MNQTAPRFAVIIGHADDPAMLELCIRHHLNVGAGQVFVSLNRDDAGIPAAFAGDDRVRAAHVASFSAADPFLYFSESVRQVLAWQKPDWVLFTDSDEFWLPQGNSLAEIKGLAETDLVIVERFNTPLLRFPDGAIRIGALADPRNLPLVSAREWLDDAYLAGDTNTPWIMAQDAPKLLVRPELIGRVGSGAHSILASNPNPRWLMPDDLLIIHAPFTTEARFRAKIAAIHETLARFGERFDSRQAWHWRYWLTLDDTALTAEFQRQSFRESAVRALRAQGILATAAEQYGKLRAAADKLRGHSLQEALGRAIGNYVRPDEPVTAPAAPPPSPLEPAAAPPPPNPPAPAIPVAAAPPPPPRAAPLPSAAGAPAPAAPPAAAAGRAAAFTYAPERNIDDPADCYFYHSMTIPEHGEVVGQWDLRGQESVYLGGVALANREVLEIGTASGFIGHWMDAQGAKVTSFDLDENQAWDIVPFSHHNQERMIAGRKNAVRQINNSWWFARKRMKSKARMIYGNVYNLDRHEKTYDLVTVNSVLLHLQNPFQALTQAAARSHNQIVVTDVAQRQFLGTDGQAAPGQLSMHFIPRVRNKGPIDTWWIVPEQLAREFLGILGFQTVELTYHRQRFLPDEDWFMYTLVGTR